MGYGNADVAKDICSSLEPSVILMPTQATAFERLFDGGRTPNTSEIDSVVSRIFRSISFEHWVRLAQGYPTSTVKEFLKGISLIRCQCWNLMPPPSQNSIGLLPMLISRMRS